MGPSSNRTRPACASLGLGGLADGCAARIINPSSACGGGPPGLAGRLGRSEKHEPDLPGLGARLCWNRRHGRNDGIGVEAVSDKLPSFSSEFMTAPTRRRLLRRLLPPLSWAGPAVVVIAKVGTGLERILSWSSLLFEPSHNRILREGSNSLPGQDRSRTTRSRRSERTLKAWGQVSACEPSRKNCAKLRDTYTVAKRGTPMNLIPILAHRF